jgi:hypothetical protein
LNALSPKSLQLESNRSVSGGERTERPYFAINKSIVPFAAMIFFSILKSYFI